MKVIYITLVLALVSFSAQAQIHNSALDLRHQELITQSVASQCQLSQFIATELETTVIALPVDQGVVDYSYETKLEIKVKIDQGMFDIYHTTIKSAYYDYYDHETKNWGVYEINSVSNCVLQ